MPVNTAACPTTQDACIQAVLNMINTARQQNSVAPVTLSSIQTTGTGTCVGSIGHSKAMQQSGSIWHTNPSYPQASFPTNVCIAYGTAGENVGMAQFGNEMNDLQWMHDQMMAENHTTCSTDWNHACNILYSTFTTVGIGIYNINGATWLTEDFTG
jgi:hypothetical protein